MWQVARSCWTKYSRGHRQYARPPAPPLARIALELTVAEADARDGRTVRTLRKAAVKLDHGSVTLADAGNCRKLTSAITESVR